MLQSITLRRATPADDPVLAQHFYQMWRDLNVPPEEIRPDWRDRTLRYIAKARETLEYAAFIAEVQSAEGKPLIIGSAGCQIFDGLYPLVLMPTYRKDGYIWGVFVEAAYRRQGIARQLTEAAIAHLKAIGCARAVLNASPMGRSVYEKMGFVPGNALFLELRESV